jgi:hypothetical protein
MWPANVQKRHKQLTKRYCNGINKVGILPTTLALMSRHLHWIKDLA